MAGLRGSSATIDGEVVCCDANGLSVFEELHSRRHDGSGHAVAFDLLELDGEDLRPQPLHARKARLEKLRSYLALRLEKSPGVPGALFF
jgi:bifunctional non-homologous end joining protein LigD